MVWVNKKNRIFYRQREKCTSVNPHTPGCTPLPPAHTHLRMSSLQARCKKWIYSTLEKKHMRGYRTGHFFECTAHNQRAKDGQWAMLEAIIEWYLNSSMSILTRSDEYFLYARWTMLVTQNGSRHMGQQGPNSVNGFPRTRSFVKVVRNTYIPTQRYLRAH